MATYTHYPSERAKHLLHSYKHPNPFIHVDGDNPVVGVLLDMCAPRKPKLPQQRPVVAHKRVAAVQKAKAAEAEFPKKSMVSYRREIRPVT